MVTKRSKSVRGGRVTDWVTQSEAAAERRVGVNVIGNWLLRGRLKHSKEVYGKRLVSLSEVMRYEPLKGGRPKTEKGRKK